jgi:hypothetical protein
VQFKGRKIIKNYCKKEALPILLVNEFRLMSVQVKKILVNAAFLETSLSVYRLVDLRRTFTEIPKNFS